MIYIFKAWQLGVDAKNEAYNIYSDAWTHTADVYTDIAYTGPSWTQITEAKAIKSSEDDKKSEMDVFTVEKNYEPAIMPEASISYSNDKVCIKDAYSSETSI